MKKDIKSGIDSKTRVLDALGGIDDKYLSEALSLHEDIVDSTRRAKFPTLFTKRFAAVAACLLIAVALVPLAFIISQSFNKGGDVFDPMIPGADFEGPLEDSPGDVYGIKLTYAGYTSSIAPGALNFDKLSIDSVQHLPIYKAESLAELDAFKQGWRLNFDEAYDGEVSFNDVTEAYDDAFFADNTLLIIYVSSASGTYRYGVWDVYLKGGELCVHVERINDKGLASEDMSGWFITLEIPNAILEDCTSFDADLNNF